ncbi:MAG: DUF2079 domain-containing protein [Chloroflexia bacterium]
MTARTVADPAAPLLSEAEDQARSDRVGSFAAWVERLAPSLLFAAMALYVVVFFAASFYKYEHFGQGYDQVDFEQAIWNTVQGHPFEDSRFNFTDSIFGLDWMPLLAVFVPFYALLPSPHTLFFLQILAAAVGAWPVYLLARDRLGSARAGLVFGLAWLLYPTVEHSVLDPFQIRIFATVLLLFALLYFERRQLWPFLLCCGLAMLARTDVALVVIMFGVYALVARRGWGWVAAPLILGLGYFLPVMTLVLPAFVHLPAVNCVGPIPADQIDHVWPGSSNPNLGYYLQWGCTPGMIAVNLVKDPLYTLGYMLGDLHKWIYLADMLAPLAFLSLLAPARLLLALPILGLNLIAWRPAQTEYNNHYQLLITVGVVYAAVAGFAVGLRRFPRRRDILLGTLLLVAVVVNLLLHNPVSSAFRFPESPARIAAARELIAQVPPGAHVAASSRVAPHLLPRRYIYNFPPAPYSPYTMSDFGPLDYILVDTNAQENNSNLLPDGRTALQALAGSPEWKLQQDEQHYRLYVRTH